MQTNCFRLVEEQIELSRGCSYVTNVRSSEGQRLGNTFFLFFFFSLQCSLASPVLCDPEQQVMLVGLIRPATGIWIWGLGARRKQLLQCMRAGCCNGRCACVHELRKFLSLKHENGLILSQCFAITNLLLSWIILHRNLNPCGKKNPFGWRLDVHWSLCYPAHRPQSVLFDCQQGNRSWSSQAMATSVISDFYLPVTLWAFFLWISFDTNIVFNLLLKFLFLV